MSAARRTFVGMRTPEEIAADVKVERIREAVGLEIAERGRTSAGRIARRTGLPVDEVRALLPVAQQRAGWSEVLAAA